MNTQIQDTPRIYVGTYRKYNNGSIGGKWMELEDYANKEDFIEACTLLHKDESDPEFMFQDWENLPSGVGLIDEGYVKESLWDWLALDEDERELLGIYLDHVDGEANLETAQENFAGRHDSEKDFAAEWTHETSGEADFDSIESRLGIVIDWEATWNCNLRHSFSSVRHNGEFWFFHNN